MRKSKKKVNYVWIFFPLKCIRIVLEKNIQNLILTELTQKLSKCAFWAIVYKWKFTKNRRPDNIKHGCYVILQLFRRRDNFEDRKRKTSSYTQLFQTFLKFIPTDRLVAKIVFLKRGESKYKIVPLSIYNFLHTCTLPEFVIYKLFFWGLVVH